MKSTQLIQLVKGKKLKHKVLKPYVEIVPFKAYNEEYIIDLRGIVCSPEYITLNYTFVNEKDKPKYWELFWE